VETVLVTLDTNVLDPGTIERLSNEIDVPCEFAAISVSLRERGDVDFEIEVVPEVMIWGEGRWGEAVWGGKIPELFVLDESLLDSGVLAEPDSGDVLEAALAIISNRSFPSPGYRDELSRGEGRQLRDAMVFEAHVRARRHVLVTGDKTGFVKHGRRALLEGLGKTRILTPDEFGDCAREGLLRRLLEWG